ncbi:MAG: hypothetical protein ACOX08_09225 [Methanobacterium sp.]|jgi:hypothetical protein|uniref:hypothetical protein n=1 Tax=Methanobacterium sp. MZD130B TaxID=3394378 RepID=UPI00176656E9|nr:hypothetical protein [Methanobacterium sp.]
MKLIAETFNSRFDHWGIVLPEEDMQNRSGGYIQNAGWLIQYCFGNDDHGEYLDYYAAHRMTDDEHVRIYEDGQVKNLPALRSMRLVSKDPVEDKRLEDEYYQENQQIAKMLAEKGFDKFTINMFLHAGLDKKTE